MTSHHLAQVNVARMAAPLHTPKMRGFRAAVGRVNTAAEAAQGFVWRLQDESGDATGIAFLGDPTLIVNASVWERLADLEAYLYSDPHREVLQNRRKWFEPLGRPTTACWYVPVGHRPDVAECEQAITTLWEDGPTRTVFALGQGVPPPPP